MSAGYDNIFLAVFLLLLLGAVTIEACRRDHLATLNGSEGFLFRGRLPIHSLASNIGATFSVTYFFGAIFIYAQLFHSWFVFILALSFLVVFWLYKRVLRRAEELIPAEDMLKQRGNILLELMRRVYPSRGFSAITSIYIIIYFGLLIEELAVSRLIFASIIPGRPLIVSFLMWVICLVIVIYLSSGGFRAVLIADLVQGSVLSAFFVMLAFLVVKRGTLENIVDFPTDHLSIRLSNLFFVGTLALAWFLAGIDYFSRFNFDAASFSELSSKRLRLARTTVVTVFLALSLGVLFSQSLSTEIPARIAPSQYVGALAEFFLVKSAPVYRVVFLVSVHCMVFTTIDTLLVTLLQISSYKERNPLNPRRLLPIILSAATVSSLVNLDRVHIVGIFIASLLVLPALAVMKVIFPGATGWLPTRTTYLWWALCGSFVAFLVVEPRMAMNFEYHFLLPGIPLTLAFAGIAFEGFLQWRRGDRNDQLKNHH